MNNLHKSQEGAFFDESVPFCIRTEEEAQYKDELQQMIAPVSNQLDQLASDLASFNNPPDACEEMSLWLEMEMPLVNWIRRQLTSPYSKDSAING